MCFTMTNPRLLQCEIPRSAKYSRRVPVSAFTVSCGQARGELEGVIIFSNSAKFTKVNIYPGLDAGSVIAAFAGAVIFVLSAVDFPIWKRLLLFLVSVVVGVQVAGFTALALSERVLIEATAEVRRWSV